MGAKIVGKAMMKIGRMLDSPASVNKGKGLVKRADALKSRLKQKKK
jgi:hypothetical protein